MNLSTFLQSNNYNSQLKEIILNIAEGSIKVYEKLNEDGDDVFGSIGAKNIQNEDVQKLDLIANDIFIKMFQKNLNIDSVLSEENDNECCKGTKDKA